MIVTKHGKKRIKQRLGLPKRAHMKHLHRVVKNGILYSREEWKKFMVVYLGFLYVFALDDELTPILVTAYKIE